MGAGSVRASVQSTMTGAIPSLRIAEAAHSLHEGQRWRCACSFHPRAVLAAENVVASSRTLLTGIGRLRSGEQLIIRWALRPGSPRAWREPQNPSERTRETARLVAARRPAGRVHHGGLGLDPHGPRWARARELASGTSRACCAAATAVRWHTHHTRARRNRTLASMPRTTRTSGMALDAGAAGAHRLAAGH